MVRRGKPFLLLALAVLICGCNSGSEMTDDALDKMAGGKRQETVPVSGKVTIGGAPTGGVLISCYTQKSGLKPVAEARTKDDGTYCWTTYTGCDGLPAEKYTLGFQHVPKEGKGKKAGEDLLQGRFKDPTKSGFSLEVVAGKPQTDVNYDLK